MVKKKKQTKKQIPIFIILALIIAITLIIFTVGVERENTIKRDIQRNVKPGEVVTITLNVKVKSENVYYALEERIPTGWEVVNDGGGKTVDPQKLSWVVFEDAKKTSFIYTVKAPEQAGEYSFDGTFLFNDLTEPVSIKGDMAVRVG